MGVRVHRIRRRVGASRGEEEVPMVIFWRRENSGRAEQAEEVGLRFISACSGVRGLSGDP